jgi:hypothetical protein
MQSQTAQTTSSGIESKFDALCKCSINDDDGCLLELRTGFSSTVHEQASRIGKSTLHTNFLSHGTLIEIA